MTEATGEGIVLLGVGDSEPILETKAHSLIELVLPTLQAADIRVAQSCRLYAERGAQQLAAVGHSSNLRPPETADMFHECGFDVVSLASNRTMDHGPEALAETMELFRNMGISTIGVGMNSDEARRPAIIERKGIKVAILGYCSVGRDGYWATPNSPGIAPLRAHTYYEPLEYHAGMPPRVVTLPFAEDLGAMVEDIKAARRLADSVVLSIHWGIHWIPRMIADYQELYALAAFSAGADLIIGHHAHVPKAVASYGKKVCFYSVGNFLGDSVQTARDAAEKHGVVYDDALKMLIARACITKEGMEEASFLPVIADERSRPEPLSRNDPRFGAFMEHMDWVSDGYPHHFVADKEADVICCE